MTLDVDAQKRDAGEAAAALVESGMVVGLGTGSTVAWFVKALAAARTGCNWGSHLSGHCRPCRQSEYQAGRVG